MVPDFKIKRPKKFWTKMPLKRSESARTTLSMYAQKAGKYQKWLGMVNVLLLLSSLVLLFTGVIFKLNYFMDKLGFISVHFEASILD